MTIHSNQNWLKASGQKGNGMITLCMMYTTIFSALTLISNCRKQILYETEIRLTRVSALDKKDNVNLIPNVIKFQRLSGDNQPQIQAIVGVHVLMKSKGTK